MTSLLSRPPTSGLRNGVDGFSFVMLDRFSISMVAAARRARIGIQTPFVVS
jgi:hypothetical protein